MRTAIHSILLILVVALGAPALAQDQYSNTPFGFSARKPVDWHYLTAEQFQENVKARDFSDPKIKELVARHTQKPFFAVTKYKEPYPDLNPSVSVNVREAGDLKGVPPVQSLQAFSAAFARVFKDFSIAEGPLATKVSGHPAAYMRMNSTFEAAGQAWRATSEMWLVPRGDVLFLISASTREDQKNGTRKEVRGIIGTINIK
jgi:hypothetical protein